MGNWETMASQSEQTVQSATREWEGTDMGCPGKLRKSKVALTCAQQSPFQARYEEKG